MAFLLAAAMVFLALEPFVDRKPSGPFSAAGRNVQDLTVEGEDLFRFVAGNVGVLNLTEQGDETPHTLLHVFLEQREAYDTPLYGPHLILDSDIERNFENRRIRISITARAASEWGASEMEANYSSGRYGESGWERFKITPAFETYSFEYEVPATDANIGYDYLAVRPVVPEKQRALEIRSINFKTLSPKRQEG